MITAGRELDALVAEKVMGADIELHRYDDYDTDYVFKSPGHPKCLVPRFSTDIAAAWEVVVKLKMAVESDGSLWRAGTKLPGHGNLYWDETEEADTAPLAICLAALKVLGVQWTA